ncbi:MAG TPA: hypothetical protein VHU40_11830 [Polyangia bacterium]|jgi:hypothetical protein|nr:hypothetical protein [Polyangia bacterium]
MFRSLASLAALLVVASLPAAASAQACCAATGLVIPARLRVYEDWAAGFQARVRSTYGNFSATGDFATVADGDLLTEQDLFVMARPLPRLQAALLVPFVQTYRRVPGQSEWGGFFGDIAASFRYELLRTGDFRRGPAVTLLAALSAPTGRAPDQAKNTLGTDAAGTGSFEATFGIEIEQLFTRWFLSLDAWVMQRTSRDAPGGRQSFAPRLTALLAAGYAFESEVAVGVFASASRQADRTSTGATGIAIATAGVAVLFPVDQTWRLQAASSLDTPVWGRNQPTTVGFSTALLRVW